MKSPKLYLIVGLLIVAAISWESCSKKESKRESTTESSIAQRQRQHANREPRSRLEEIRNFFQHADIRMEFYGKVVDENGQGMPDVTIHYTIQKAGNYLESGMIENTDEKKRIQSSADGTFEIKGAKGLTLAVGPFEKVGYRDGLRDPRSFGFKGTPELHQANSREPITFVIISSDIPKTKQTCNKTLEFAWNQGEVRIPLGKKLGDFVLVPTRLKSQDELRDFDWNIKVSMDRAELASLGEYYAPIAPDAGYQSSFEYGARKGDSKWRGGLQATYAFKTAEGLFGPIRFTLYPEREDFVVNGSLDVRLNESGSRNLD